MDFGDPQHLLADAGERRQNGRDGHDGDITTPPGYVDDLHPKKRGRPLRVRATPGEAIDRRIVSFSLYNAFNYSLFTARDCDPLRLSLGVISPSFGEGKTTTACNLATALSTGSGRRTIVVDFNLAKPRIHHVFGVPRGPGLTEALVGEDICISPTRLENLYVLPVGNLTMLPPEKLPLFREILSSLFDQFEFVIVDMPSTVTRTFPTLIANQLSGLLVVVRARVTRRRELDRLFRKVRQENVLGFVINGVKESDL